MLQLYNSRTHQDSVVHTKIGGNSQDRAITEKRTTAT